MKQASPSNNALLRAIFVSLVAGLGCAPTVHRFPLLDPVWVDDDLHATSVPCRADPDHPKEEICRPEEYVSPFLWDVADKSYFRPVSQFLAADMGFEAKNVNSFDEVPDSSWFTNRIGLRDMTPAQVKKGSCGKSILDAPKEPGKWVIDMGKDNGANPGFRINIEGIGKFMLKVDEGEVAGEKATGATAIASRIYHAAGWFVACDTVVYLDRSWLKLTPGLHIINNEGVTVPLTEARVDEILNGGQKRNGLYRVAASQWLEGRTIGPFEYEGKRKDDPNDIIEHDDRRDLRGARLIAAWLGHTDSREQNTMVTWNPLDKKRKDSSPGVSLHYYIDMGDCFGTHWPWENWSRRMNHTYYFDTGDQLVDLFTLGMVTRPWDSRTYNDLQMFDFFEPHFAPEDWKGGYPTPAFNRMTERDGAWVTRIITRFTDADVRAAVEVADFTDPRATEFLVGALIGRRNDIRKRYFAKLSPLADPIVHGDEVCLTDLARASKTWGEKMFSYSSKLYKGSGLRDTQSLTVTRDDTGGVCIKLPRIVESTTAANDAPERYAVLDVLNGIAKGPLRLHFYDLGVNRGFKLVAIQRPSDGSPDF